MYPAPVWHDPSPIFANVEPAAPIQQVHGITTVSFLPFFDLSIFYQFKYDN